MAFDFPPAQDGLRVTNPESGVTYVYRSKYQSWIIEGVDNQQVRIHTVCCTPCDARQGDIWFDPCTNCAHVFHDGEWLPIVDCTGQVDCVNYRGEKANAGQLPVTGQAKGDLWVVLDEFALYMWTSDGWLPADRFDDTELRQLIKDEEAARIANDVELQRQITFNKSQSEKEDKLLWEALEKEEEARKSGDQAITDLLEDCCTKAQDGLTDLQEQLDQEIQDRTDGDGAQQNLIDHITSDLAGTNDRLDQEIQDRIDGDEQLHQEIVEEGQYREAYDEKLLELIREKESKYMGEVDNRGQLPLTRYDWKPLTHFQCETIYSMSWGGDCFIAGSSDGHVWSSDDGLQWERRHVGVAFNGNVTATCYAEGVFLIGGDGGFLSRSVDGKNWHNFGNSTTTSNIQDFAYGGGRFVYVTDGGVVALSEDKGYSWTKQDHTIRWGVHGIDSILTVTYSEHLSCFVAGTKRGMILLSDTGVGWELRDPNLYGTGQILTITSVEWLNQPTLIAGGDFPDRLIYSVDGNNWTTAPKDYFKGAVPTDIKSCDDGNGSAYCIAALSDGSTAFAGDDRIQSWTIEGVGAGERLLAIVHAPTNANVPINGGIHVTGGNFGKAFVRLPGKGLEPGDTWIVLNPNKCLYTWSSKGWIVNCGGAGGGGGDTSEAIFRLTSADNSVRFNPATGLPDPAGALDLSVVGGAGGAHLGVDPPLAAEDGDLWIREPSNKLYFWDGKFWVEVTSSGGSGSGGGSTIGDQPPTSPGAGDLWVREPELNLYVWTGTEWVQTNAVAGGGGGSTGGGSSFGPNPPSNPQPGDRYVSESTLKDYVWTGDEWIQIGSISGGGGGGGSTDPVEGLPSFGETLPDNPEPGHRHVLEPLLIDYVFTGDEWIQISGSTSSTKRDVGMLDSLTP